MNVINFKTTKCVYCYNKPDFWGGHVTAKFPKFDQNLNQIKESEPNVIIAGVCEKHKGRPTDKGFHGEWTPEMGIELYNSYNI